MFKYELREKKEFHSTYKHLKLPEESIPVQIRTHLLSADHRQIESDLVAKISWYRKVLILTPWSWGWASEIRLAKKYLTY
jgi:hypothetical protein